MELKFKVDIPDNNMDGRISGIEKQLRTQPYGRMVSELSEIRKLLYRQSKKPDKYEKLDIRPVLSKLSDIHNRVSGIGKLVTESKSLSKAVENQSYDEITRAIGNSTSRLLDALKNKKSSGEEISTAIDKLGRKLDKFSLPRTIFIDASPRKQIVPFPV